MDDTICIMPVGNINDRIIEAVGEAVKYFGFTSIVHESLDVPLHAFNKARGQYRASTFLRIAEKGVGKKNIIVTSVNIYAHRVNFVFGQALLNGKSCVISTYMLDQKLYANDGGEHDIYGTASNNEMLIERVKKEAIHELGHTFGLRHCDNPGCVMSFSPGLEEVDIKKSYFCDKCGHTFNAI